MSTTIEAPATTPDALDHAERVLALARSLKACGNRIVSVMVSSVLRCCAVTLDEADFRRQFAGLVVTQNPPPLPELSTQVDGVEVKCWLPHAALKAQPKEVAL